MKKLFALGIGASILLGGVIAQAAAFNLRIRNTSQKAWTEGLVAKKPFITTVGGRRPLPGTPDYYTYVFGSDRCNVACGTGCVDTGNATVLASRLGYVLGTDAWYVPAIAVGATVSVTIDVVPGQRISYATHVVGSSDDLVMMNQLTPTNDAHVLAVDMFDADSLPLSSPRFSLSGYDLNSTSAVDGDTSSCALACPPASGDTCYVAVSNGSTGGPIPAQPVGPALTKAWTYTATGYTTDAIALGDVTSATGSELVVTAEAAKYYSPGPWAGSGRALVLTNAGSLVSGSVFDDPGGHDFMGFPMIEDLDLKKVNNKYYGEFLMNEYASALAPGASVFARFLTSTSNWTSTGYGYPSFWNMGPSAGDVRSDLAGNEVVIADWDGNVSVLAAKTGTALNTYNVWNDLSLGEHVYGHAAIGDVGLTTGNEIVVFGAQTGRAIALKATSAGMSVGWKSEPIGTGRAYGSGAAIGDIDADGKNEIVVEAYGGNRIYAYDTSYGTGCKYYWDVPGASAFYWTSPVIGDVDGDTKREVVVFANNSLLGVLSTSTTDTASCKKGTVVWTYTVGNGGSSWFAPALGQLTGSSKLDVVVANYKTIEVVDVAARTVGYRFTDKTATFYPSAVFEPLGSTQAAIYVSGWINGNVYRLETPAGAGKPVAWSSFMGGNTRSGAR